MMTSNRAIRSLAFSSLAISLAACQSWKVEQRPVETVVREQSGPVAVTMKDQRWVVLKDARLVDDSIVGTQITGTRFGSARTALALTGVRVVEKRRFSLGRTLGMGIAAAFLPSLYKLALVEND